MIIKYLRPILTLVIINFALISCGQSTNKEDAKNQTIENISSESLNNSLGNIQLIDVRTPNEFKEGYIKGAKNINFFDRDFLNKMSTLDKNKPVYLYCKSGNRSGKAADMLKKKGFTKIYNLDGGILNWQRKNLTLEK